jgi:hypothetical protein
VDDAALGDPPDKKARLFPAPGNRLSRTGRKYRLSAVGFVDTLGAKAFAASEVFMNALAFMVDRQERINLTRPAAPQLRTTYFSDNIGASIVIEGLDTKQQQRAVCQVLRLLAGIQLSYLREFAILCRGGIAIGQCFHNENVLFGPALVQAYLLEQTASSPRIALSAGVAALAVGDVVPLLPAEPLLNRDGEPAGMAQAIDFMTAELPPEGPSRSTYIAGLADAVAKGVQESADGGGDVLSKWEWTQHRLAALKRDIGIA